MERLSLEEAIITRHAVRQYRDEVVPNEVREELLQLVCEVNEKSGLHFQIYFDEPNAYNCMTAHYGRFRNVKNYVALVGKKSEQYAIGYYGEMVVLRARQLGLHSCWAMVTFTQKNTPIIVPKGEKLICVVSLGYGVTEGKQNRKKDIEKLYSAKGTPPEWFLEGVRLARLAPSGLNLQAFKFILNDDETVSFKHGPLAGTKVDVGIACYHFEIGSKKEGLFSSQIQKGG